ncbi:hypothetical protein [Candidatus Nitrosocosmicus sp. R]
MGCKNRNTPARIELQLRQESNFGCAMCGCPILENAHIIPFRESHEFRSEDMVSLCPTCHTRADHGHYPESVLRDAKKNPHNKKIVKDKFEVTGKDLIVHLGNLNFINTEHILQVDSFDVISLRRKYGNYLSLDFPLYDSKGKLYGAISDNVWFVNSSELWDIDYKPQHLIIRSGPRRIVLEIEIKNEEVFIRGNIFYKFATIEATKD